MKPATKLMALLPSIKQIGQGLVMLSLLVLFGAGVGRSHSASTPTGVRIAATNGDIRVGGATAPALAATNGDIRVNT